jgi:hypothetical protein
MIIRMENNSPVLVPVHFIGVSIVKYKVDMFWFSPIDP